MTCRGCGEQGSPQLPRNGIGNVYCWYPDRSHHTQEHDEKTTDRYFVDLFFLSLLRQIMPPKVVACTPPRRDTSKALFSATVNFFGSAILARVTALSLLVRITGPVSPDLFHHSAIARSPPLTAFRSLCIQHPAHKNKSMSCFSPGSNLL